jgi:hypothetical protein
VFISVTRRLSLQLPSIVATDEEKKQDNRSGEKDASRIDELDHQTFAESKLTRKSSRLRNPLKKTNRHPDLR